MMDIQAHEANDEHSVGSEPATRDSASDHRSQYVKNDPLKMSGKRTEAGEYTDSELSPDAEEPLEE